MLIVDARLWQATQSRNRTRPDERPGVVAARGAGSGSELGGGGQAGPLYPYIAQPRPGILLIEHDMGLMMRIAYRIIVVNFGVKTAEGTISDTGACRRLLPGDLGFVNAANSSISPGALRI